MVTRRGVVAGMLAAGMAPRMTWADAGGPTVLSAARTRAGDYVFCGLSDAGDILFQLPLPGRGHAGAAHPERPEAVVFARRPGVFAIVIDCTSGAVLTRLEAPEGRHFYGHGTFSQDGSVLYTTENDYDAARGVIGLWDTSAGYARIGEWDAGGIGPHEILRLPGRDVLAVANGGIETHPDSGRVKLNIPTMRPNLSYLSNTGEVLETVELEPNLHKASIRHLAAREDRTVAFAMQWQSDETVHPPLLGLHRLGNDAPRLLTGPDADHRALRGYVGSVAFSGAGDRLAITSPRGGVVEVFDPETGSHLATHTESDVCGLAAIGDHFVLTRGSGEVLAATPNRLTDLHRAPLAWDNHLVSVM